MVPKTLAHTYSVFFCVFTTLLSRNFVRHASNFCFGEISISVSFLLTSCDPFEKIVFLFTHLSNCFACPSLSLLCSCGFELVCLGAEVFRSWMFARFSSKLLNIFSWLLWCFFFAFESSSSFKFTKVIFKECRYWNNFRFAEGNRLITSCTSFSVAFGMKFSYKLLNERRIVLISPSICLQLSSNKKIWWCRDQFSSPYLASWRTRTATDVIFLLNWGKT